ncbi:MAG TPA: S8 family serine peptidase [Nocardioidaceae bacterium]|nr:S8 family serine peptidase [Nocardioidaceae bacterium]
MSARIRMVVGGLMSLAVVGSLSTGSAFAGPDADSGGWIRGGTPDVVGRHDANAPAASVTLITGDRVIVTRSADGTPSAAVASESPYYSRLVGDDLYVIPARAEDDLAADRLDVELFNVTGLIEQGYDDATVDALPLIVEGELATTRSADGMSVEADLESIDATAVSVDKDDAGATYARLFGARSAGGVDKVWLDAEVESTAVALDPATGVEQTGAPQAWDRGYDGTGTTVAVLDGGYDSEHPDLAGQIAAAQDFTGSGSAEDDSGHGTHVASTIAGTGAADPSKAGMAPGAKLLVGKVLRFGSGQTSWIVDGMEWAVDQGADVVNMSLGSSEPTDCTDPMAQAATNLSAQTETLFVIAAGNNGIRETVASPGCADGVLTVGAVDADGQPADFSSRGAVLGDHRIKPDISAPGVGIVGAQADSPGGIHYIAMSGTSMATPHVAGAAALVRQAHPDWTAQQVEAALVGAVKPDADGTVYDLGAGELWTPGAIDATVTSDVSVSIGSLPWPHHLGQRATGEVTYTNDSDRPVRLTLDVRDLAGADGDPVPSYLLGLSDYTITVPARGSTSVGVVARGNVAPLRDTAYGEIGARVVARGADDVRVTTAVGYWLEPKTVDVTIRAIDRNGNPATSGTLDFTDMHQPSRTVQFLRGADLTMRLRVGSYLVGAFIRTVGADGVSYSFVGDPERRITDDTTLVLDARTARRVTASGDRPMQIASGSLGIHRTWDRWVVGSSAYAEGASFYATPSDRAEHGEFTFGSYVRAFDPAVPIQDSGYVYNLALTSDGRVPSDQSHDVSDSGLASVTEHWYAQRNPSTPEDWSRIVADDGTSPFYTSGDSPVAAPGTRTAYYTPGFAWQQLASSGNFRTFPETWFDPVRTPRAGQHRETTWFKLPTMTAMAVNADGSPARIAERQGSLVGFAFPDWQDTVPGRRAVGGLGDVGGLELWQDGQFIGDTPFPSGQADIGDGDTDLQLEVRHIRLRRYQTWEFGAATQTRFEFRTSRPEGVAVAALPIALPRYDAPVDMLNLAPAEPSFPVRVTFHGQDGYDPGEITDFSAKVSYDAIDPREDTPLEEYAWTDATVERRDGQWVVLVDNTPAAGGVVSLWITATDSHGTRTEQITARLYGVH